MERLGTALSLVTPEDVAMLRTIERLLGRSMERHQIDRFAPAAGTLPTVNKPAAQPAAPQSRSSSWQRRQPVNRSRPFPAYRRVHVPD